MEVHAPEYEKIGSLKAQEIRNWIKSAERIVQMLKELPTPQEAGHPSNEKTWPYGRWR